MYTFRNFDLLTSVPPSLIHHQKYALLLAHSHLFGELIERHREQLYIDRGQDQPVHLSALGLHEAVEVGPLVSSLEASTTGLFPTGAHTRRITGFRPNRASSSALHLLSPAKVVESLVCN